MHDLKTFSDEAFVIVDCASSIVNDSLTIVLDRPLCHIYPDQQAFLYAKKLHYNAEIVLIECIDPQVCKISWGKIFRPIGAVLYIGTYGFVIAKASKLQYDLQSGIYNDCIASTLNAFGTDFVDTPLECE